MSATPKYPPLPLSFLRPPIHQPPDFAPGVPHIVEAQPALCKSPGRHHSPQCLIRKPGHTPFLGDLSSLRAHPLSSYFKAFFGSKCISCICFYPKAMPLLISAVGDYSRPQPAFLSLLALDSSRATSTYSLAATSLVVGALLLLGMFEQFPGELTWKGKFCLPVL